MTFAERVQMLKSSTEALAQMTSNTEETGMLVELRNQLEPLVLRFKNAVQRKTVLEKSGVQVEIKDRFQNLLDLSVSLSRKFKADRTAASLKKGNLWPSLLDSLKTASGALTTSTSNSWRIYCEQVFAGDPPEVVERRIALTEKNRLTLNRYRQLSKEFSEISVSVPGDVTIIKALNKKAEELKQVSSQFDYDVPGPVKEFLQAIQSGGASLDMLTDDVRTWLSDNHSLSRYRIISK